MMNKELQIIQCHATFKLWNMSPAPGGPTPSPSSNVHLTPRNSNSPTTPMMQPPRLPQGHLKYSFEIVFGLLYPRA